MDTQTDNWRWALTSTLNTSVKISHGNPFKLMKNYRLMRAFKPGKYSSTGSDLQLLSDVKFEVVTAAATFLAVAAFGSVYAQSHLGSFSAVIC